MFENKCDFVDMSETPLPSSIIRQQQQLMKPNHLDNLLDDALTDFNKTSTSTTKKETVVSSSETAPPPSDPLQSTFEAMCFNDEKFLNELGIITKCFIQFSIWFR